MKITGTPASWPHYINLGKIYAKDIALSKQETQDAYQAIEAVITWERFIGTVEEAEQLSATAETDTTELLISRYGQFLRYTKELLSTFTFQGTTANTPLLEALQVLKELNETGKRSVPESAPKSAPTDFVKGRWEKHVLQEEQVERHAYELCALSELRSGLRSGDIWISGSRQYKAFEDYLMPHGQWGWIKQAGETEAGRGSYMVSNLA